MIGSRFRGLKFRAVFLSLAVSRDVSGAVEAVAGDSAVGCKPGDRTGARHYFPS